MTKLEERAVREQVIFLLNDWKLNIKHFELVKDDILQRLVPGVRQRTLILKRHESVVDEMVDSLTKQVVRDVERASKVGGVGGKRTTGRVKTKVYTKSERAKARKVGQNLLKRRDKPGGMYRRRSGTILDTFPELKVGEQVKVSARGRVKLAKVSIPGSTPPPERTRNWRITRGKVGQKNPGGRQIK